MSRYGLGVLSAVCMLVLACPIMGQESITVDFSVGKKFSRGVLGQNPRRGLTTRSAAVTLANKTFLRGVAGGLDADTYDWRDVSSGVDNGQPSITTLEFLRNARDASSEPILTVNAVGFGSKANGEWECSNTPVVEVAALAADWVHYTNFILGRYTTATLSNDARSSGLLAVLKWGTADTLRKADEPKTPHVTYWEIGDEPDVDSITDYIFGHKLSPDDYADRYQAIVQAMRKEDPDIKTGPNLSNLDGMYLDKLVQKCPKLVDFVSYHPFYNRMIEAWPEFTAIGEALKGIKAHQKGLRDQAAKYGHKLIASQYNPSSSAGSAEPVGKSIAQCLGIAETVFTFAELGLQGAAYWDDPAASSAVVKTFQLLRDYAGDTLVKSYSDGNSFRLYAVADDSTKSYALWCINFSDENTKDLSIASVGMLQKSYVVTADTLGVNSASPALDASDASIGLKTVDLTSKIDPNSFTYSISPASITVIRLTPTKLQ